MKHPIVVGTDMTSASDDALVRAEALATRDSVELTVVHAVSPLLCAIGDYAEHLARLREQVEQRTTAITGRPRNAYHVVIERGLPHAVLARRAIANDALLVVGAHMHHGLGHALLKNVSSRVIERARGPVLVAKPGADSGQVLVAVEPPFEFSESLGVAIEEARATGSELAVLHCVDTAPVHALTTRMIDSEAYARRHMGPKAALTEARHALRADFARRRIRAELWLFEGAVHSLISDVARRTRARLVVLGSGHGKRSLDTTNAVLRYAPCSVLVVDNRSALDRDFAPDAGDCGESRTVG